MGVKPGKKSFGGNTSVGGAAATPKTPDNKRKSLPKPTPATPIASNKKPAPAPASPSPKKEVMTSEKKPVMKKGGISAQLSKVSEQSKAINKSQKKNRNKQNRNKNKDTQKGDGGPAKQAGAGKVSKKNRRQRLQAKMSAKPRSPLSQSRAFKAEQEMNKTSNRILQVRLPDPVITNETVKAWSSSIENAMFPKSIDPRSFMIVMKPDANIKKEIETLKKISFGGGKLSVEERKYVEFEGKKGGEGLTPADYIDPYTLYLTNLDEATTRGDLQELFKSAKTVMNPRKHNPRVSGSGTATKFAFVGFDTADAALEGFKMCFNKKFVGDKFIVVRFRRVGKGEVSSAKEVDVAAAVEGAGKRKAEESSLIKGQPLKKDDAKKSKLIKVEPKEEEDDDEDDEDDDDDEEEDDDDTIGAGEEDDDSEDDEDDGLDDDDDDDDDDDE